MDDLFALSRQMLSAHYREYQRYFLKKHSLSGHFSLIIGQRGVGKTTAAVQYMRQSRSDALTSDKILYIQCDHFLLGKRSLYEIAEAFSLRGGLLICFDEIHKFPDWSRQLKSITDTFPTLRILATGSSALQIRHGSHDLSRRAVVYQFAPCSLREFIELSTGLSIRPISLADIIARHEQIAPEIIAILARKQEKILPLFDRYLIHGCYPYFLDYSDVEVLPTLIEQGIHTTVENDLLAVHPSLSGASIRKIKQLLSFIAQSVPFSPDMAKLRRLLDVGDERTLKNYFTFLEDGEVIMCFWKGGKSLARLIRPEKVYLGNPNQMYALGRRAPESKGTTRETFFAFALKAADQALAIPPSGDFLVNDSTVFEIGGKNKDYSQIRGVENSYLAVDDIEIGVGRKVPLWLFGMLY